MKQGITALIVALITLVTYPALNKSAILERGYDAFGGEELLLILGIVITILILAKSGKKHEAARPKANRPTTESEQSKNHFDA